MGDADHLGLLGLNEVSHVLQAILEDSWGNSSSGGFSSSGGLCNVFDAGSFSLFGLRLVLHQELEKFGGLIFVKSGVELVQCWWDLESLKEDLLFIRDVNGDKKSTEMTMKILFLVDLLVEQKQ